MSEFQVYYHRLVVEKDIPSLDKPTRQKIKRAIETKLTANPEVFSKPLQHTLKGYRSLRVEDWRVIFKIGSKEIWIYRIGHRREVYLKALRQDHQL